MQLYDELFTHEWNVDAYNMEQELYFKENPTFETCAVCFADKDFRQMVACQGRDCYQSKICVDCIRKYWEVGLSDMGSWRIDYENGALPFCPCTHHESENRHLLLTTEMAVSGAIIPKHYYEKLQIFVTHKFLNRNCETLQCVKSSCLGIFIIENECQFMTGITCPYCDYSFCKLCGGKSHIGKTCREVEFANKFLTEVLVPAMIDLTNSTEQERRLTLNDSEIKKNFGPTFREEQLYYEASKVGRYDKALEDLVTKVVNEFYPDNAWQYFYRHKLTQILMKNTKLEDAQLIQGKADNFDLPLVRSLINKKMNDVSLQEIRRICISCPYCLNPIQRISGCNDMYCLNCMNHFNFSAEHSGNYTSGIVPIEIDHSTYAKFNTKFTNSNKAIELGRKSASSSGTRRKMKPSERRNFRMLHGRNYHREPRMGRGDHEVVPVPTSGVAGSKRYFL